ncbi:MAG TPA: PEP-CTERM sorting domain-containing protein [Phycisphaerae bacterium]|jgi:hypothetical protein
MLLARVSAVLAASVLFIATASAVPIPTLEVEWGGGAYEWYSGDPGTMEVTPNPNGGYDYTGSYVGPDWSGNWSGFIDDDPIINSAIAVTNSTPFTQTYITTLTIPTVGAIAAPSTVFCGTSVTVTGLGPATVATPPGDFLFRALVSGAPMGPPCDLLPDPFSLTTPTGLPAVAGPFNVGPAPGPGLAAIDSIGIRHAFTLTPGGTATINSTFIIIPEPGSMLLLVGGAAAMLRRRR